MVSDRTKSLFVGFVLLFSYGIEWILELFGKPGFNLLGMFLGPQILGILIVVAIAITILESGILKWLKGKSPV